MRELLYIQGGETRGNRLSSRRKCKGRYFLDKLGKDAYSTDDFTIWNFYRSFYGKPLPGEISGYKPEENPNESNFDIITFRGKVLWTKEGGIKI